MTVIACGFIHRTALAFCLLSRMAKIAGVQRRSRAVQRCSRRGVDGRGVQRVHIRGKRLDAGQPGRAQQLAHRTGVPDFAV